MTLGSGRGLFVRDSRPSRRSAAHAEYGLSHLDARPVAWALAEGRSRRRAGVSVCAPAARPLQERCGGRCGRLLPCGCESQRSRLRPGDRHTSPNQAYGRSSSAPLRSPCSAAWVCRWGFRLRDGPNRPSIRVAGRVRSVAYRSQGAGYGVTRAAPGGTRLDIPDGRKGSPNTAAQPGQQPGRHRELPGKDGGSCKHRGTPRSTPTAQAPATSTSTALLSSRAAASEAGAPTRNESSDFVQSGRCPSLNRDASFHTLSGGSSRPSSWPSTMTSRGTNLPLLRRGRRAPPAPSPTACLAPPRRWTQSHRFGSSRAAGCSPRSGDDAGDHCSPLRAGRRGKPVPLRTTDREPPGGRHAGRRPPGLRRAPAHGQRPNRDRHNRASGPAARPRPRDERGLSHRSQLRGPARGVGAGVGRVP
jgi:hypothetical protein